MSNPKISEFIPIKSISDASNDTYITLPYKEFAKTYPELPAYITDRLYYQKSIIPEIIYYSPDDMILLSTHIFINEGKFKYMSPNNSKFEEDIIAVIDSIKKELQQHTYTSFCVSVPECYQKEFISSIIDKLSDEDRDTVSYLIK